MTKFRDRLRARIDWRIVRTSRLRYAQFGEDSVLLKYFNRKRNGYFVDLGANHPYVHSNTYLLYRDYGWRGINVDADESLIERHRSVRPRDVSLVEFVGASNEPLTFTIYENRVLNTADPARVAELAGNERITGQRVVRPRTLASILDEHVPASTEIDLMSVDLEGSDLDALASNAWTRYRPRVVCVEDFEFSLSRPSAIQEFMTALGYDFFSKTLFTTFWERGDSNAGQ